MRMSGRALRSSRLRATSWVDAGRAQRDLPALHAPVLQSIGSASRRRRQRRQGKMVMYELTDRGRALLAAVTGTAPVSG
jgi:hypothetical protein